MATIIGTAGADTKIGTSGADTILLRGGNDAGFGLAGRDVLRGEAGNDTLSGGDGKDTLFGGAGRDTLYGDSGDDLLHGEAGDDLLFGGAGNDQLDGGAGRDWLHGLGGGDALFGGDGNDWLDGGAGNDLLRGGRDLAISATSEADGITAPRLSVNSSWAFAEELGTGFVLVEVAALFGGPPDDEEAPPVEIAWQVSMGQLVRDGVTNAVALDYEGVGDVLVGGAGVDTFRVGADEGVDLILDFELGVDRIRLEGGLEVASGASARASIASVGAAVAITVYILERTDGSGSTTVVLPGLSGGTVDDIFFSV